MQSIPAKTLPYRKAAAHVKHPGCLAGLIGIIVVVGMTYCNAKAYAGDVDLEKAAKRPFINRIIISGNKYFNDKTLKDKMYTREASFFAIFTKPRLSQSYIRRDIAFLEAFYHSHGFFEAKVQLKSLRYSKDRRFVDVIIGVKEGEATIVEDIDFSPTTIINLEKLKKVLMLKVDKPFNPSLLETDIYDIKNEFAKNGYPSALVEDSLYFTDHRVKIHYELAPGPKMVIDGINIKGNRMTKRSIIMKELTFRKGDVFDLDKLLESRRNLFDTALFTEAELLPENIDLDKKTVSITVRVRERKSTYIEAGFGVGNVLGSRVLAGWGDRNLFGTGRKLSLQAQYSFDVFRDDDVDLRKIKLRTKYVRYDGEFNQRHILGTKFMLGVDGFFEKDATVEPLTISTIGASIIGSRRFSKSTDLLTSLSHERIKRESPGIAYERSTSRIFAVSISEDHRDFVLNPHKGSYKALRGEVAGGILGGDNDFYSLLLSLQKYIEKGRNTVFAFRARIGYADAFGASSKTGLPIENRFFAGGGNSVRGYDENSLGPEGILVSAFEPQTSRGIIGGRVLMITNAEIRFPIPYLSAINISGAVFLDGGNVWASMRDLKLKYFRPYVNTEEIVQQDYRYSTGFGLRYNTPVGPIRLDYGMPIKRGPSDNKGRFHISLGQIF